MVMDGMMVILKFKKGDSDDTVSFIIPNTDSDINYAQNFSKIHSKLSYQQINWTPLSYFGFQLIIPISTTHSIDDEKLYFINMLMTRLLVKHLIQ